MILSTIKLKFKAWKDSRFLKLHGCASWEQYHRVHDIDINIRARSANEFYTGYPFVYCVESHSHYAYQLLYDYGPGGSRYGSNEMKSWCDKHCKEKFRVDIHRAIKALVNGYKHDWEFNELGGGDYFFFAFKNEKDYNWFLMRWS